MEEKKPKWEKPELIDLYSVTLETTGGGICNDGSYATTVCGNGTFATGGGCGDGSSPGGSGGGQASYGAAQTLLQPQDPKVGSCHLGHGPK